jgi:CheY-like chemotaxis protein
MAWNVLLVEPDAGFADEIRGAFEPAGFSVQVVGSGEEAVERVRVSPLSLVVLGAELPDMSGFSVCNRLKRALPQVPLILYTSEATDQAIAAHRATRTKADEYLRRPFDLADLLGHAANLLAKSDAPSLSPPPIAPPAPPGPPRRPPTGSQPAQGGEGPPVLQRADSGSVARMGLAAAMAAAAPQPPARPSAPPPIPGGAQGGPPPMPPPLPPGGAPRAAQALGRVKIQIPKGDPSEVLNEWPRDPAPPKGSPEEKLEFFRDRLRARDTFLAKVRDALGAAKAQSAAMMAEIDGLTEELQQARDRLAALEGQLGEAGLAGQRKDARVGELEAQLAQSESTRQSLSEVLNETMQQQEAAEANWAQRIAQSEEQRARLEAQLSEDGESHARAVAALEGDRADDRARFEAERAEAAAEKEALEAQVQAMTGERDEAIAQGKELQALLESEQSQAAEAKIAADEHARELQGRIDEASARAQTAAAELAEAGGKIEELQAEIARADEARQALESDLGAAGEETKATAEQLAAVEQALQAKQAEHDAAEHRIAELGTALEADRADIEGTRGELANVEGARAAAERRAAETQAERDRLGRDLEGARSELLAAQERTERLQGDIDRLRKLEPIAEEAVRLRRDVAQAREIVLQRTAALEQASRQAQAGGADRARLQEQLAVETGKLQAQLARMESELGAARKKLGDTENALSARTAEADRVRAEADERRRAVHADAVEGERRQQSEAARLKAAMVELERHLEQRARSELTLKKRVQELEAQPAKSAYQGPPPEEIAKMRLELERLAEEVEDLRGENDFLNGEVARYTQKNKDLSAKVGKKK